MGPELIQDTSDKVLVIKERMSQQKSYADNRMRPLEFEVGESCVPKGITYEESDAVWEEGEA
jgi:hypothetical protein